MVRWNKTERRWRRSAEEAIAAERVAAERDLMAAEVAKRIWVANGGAEWAMAENEGSLLALETLVVRYIGDGLLRAALGLKYLDRLAGTLQQADYEDVPALTAEVHWAEAFLEVAAFGAEPAVQGGPRPETPEPADRRLGSLYGELAALVLAELKAAEIAA